MDEKRKSTARPFRSLIEAVDATVAWYTHARDCRSCEAVRGDAIAPCDDGADLLIACEEADNAAWADVIQAHTREGWRPGARYMAGRRESERAEVRAVSVGGPGPDRIVVAPKRKA